MHTKYSHRVVVKCAIIIVLSLLFITCRKESPNISNPSDSDVDYNEQELWSQVFHDFWHAMNHSYIFWSVDSTDWDAIYEEYKPKFVALDNFYDVGEYRKFVDTIPYYLDNNYKLLITEVDSLAIDYFEDITSTLIDGHYSFEKKGLYRFTPDRAVKREDYHSIEYGLDEYILNALKVNPMVTELLTTSYNALGDRLTASTAKIDDIAYLRFSSFNIVSFYGMGYQPLNASDESIEKVIGVFKNWVSETPNFKGVILDLRNNTGGYLIDLGLIMSSFINKNESIHFLYTRRKAGPGRLDYTPYIKEYLYGSSNNPTNSFPIVVLMNQYTVSMGEITALFVKEFNDKSIWIGERTLGAQGSLTDDFVHAGGVVDNSQINIYTPFSISYDIDKNNYEGKGLKPDIELLEKDVIYKLQHEMDDTYLNKAIEYLRNI